MSDLDPARVVNASKALFGVMMPKRDWDDKPHLHDVVFREAEGVLRADDQWRKENAPLSQISCESSGSFMSFDANGNRTKTMAGTKPAEDQEPELPEMVRHAGNGYMIGNQFISIKSIRNTDKHAAWYERQEAAKAKKPEPVVTDEMVKAARGEMRHAALASMQADDMRDAIAAALRAAP